MYVYMYIVSRYINQCLTDVHVHKAKPYKINFEQERPPLHDLLCAGSQPGGGSRGEINESEYTTEEKLEIVSRKD